MTRYVVGFLAAAWVGLSCNSAKPQADAAAASVGLTAAPPPARLVGEFAIRKPKEFWAAIRSGIGGTVGLLADSPALVLANAAGVETQISSELLQDAAIAGVVSTTEGHDPILLVAIPFANPAKVVGDAGASDLAMLKSVEGGNGLRAAIAKSGYLVIAFGASVSEDELKRLTPYLITKVAVDARGPANLAGNLGKRRSEAGLWITGREALLPEAKRNLELSLASAKAALESANKRNREAKGRAPDFGDPEPLIGKLVESKDVLVKMLDQVGQVSAFVGTRDGEFVADLDIEAKAEFANLLSGSKTCSAQAIGDEPAQSVAAYFVCESESDRKKSAEAQAALIGNVMGSRGPDEKKFLEAFAKAWPLARGDELTASVVLAGDDGAPSLRVLSPLGQVQSADAARAALRDLLARPLVDDALHVKFGAEKKLEGGTYAISLKRKTPPKDVALTWSTDRNQMLVAASQSADAAKVSLLRNPRAKLIDASTLSRELKLLDRDVLTAFVVQPLLLTVTKQQLAPQMAVLSLSRDSVSGHAVLRFVAHTVLARELIKLRMPTE